MSTYRELGLAPLINAAGTYTKFGGSLMPPPVLEAMQEAARSFVDIDQLLQKSGEHLAELLDCEAALVTSGASAGLTQAAAACMVGTDQEGIRALPETGNRPSEFVVMRCHRNPYDQALRVAGGRFKDIGNAIKTEGWELEAAIGEETAAVVFFVQSAMFRSSLPLQDVIEIAHRREVPVIVDAAAELPPAENLHRFTAMGADLVLFSGGKELRGPQGTGLMLGKSGLITAARFNGPPHHSLGRGMKIDKESIMGLVRAVELYLEEDHTARYERWEKQVMRIVDSLGSLPGLEIERGFPNQPRCQPKSIPRAYIRLTTEIDLSEEELSEKLASGNPRIIAVADCGRLIINPHMLAEGEECIVIERIEEIVTP